ncbi:MAG: RyR domain-containing protein, partial [Verrucomicrobiales bacterium]|nr:RyR domain-containing protein [Verrucomicrobiales bacterium]
DTYREWNALTEQQKDVNRLAADHLPTKVRAIGLDPADGPRLATAWQSLDESQLDQLARMEHERWAAPLRMAGWKPGPRDDARRIHNNLVPYDELDQGTKDYDIEQVRAVPMYLGLV